MRLTTGFALLVMRSAIIRFLRVPGSAPPRARCHAPTEMPSSQPDAVLSPGCRLPPGCRCSHPDAVLPPRPCADNWQDDPMEFALAQVNIGRMRAPLDTPQLAGFMAALDPVNAVADAAPGFIWRLQTEEGNATAVRAFEWDEAGSAGVIMNMSVWESVEALAAFVYSEQHRQVLRRRREWFERMEEAYLALWWIPRGHIPATGEA